LQQAAGEAAAAAAAAAPPLRQRLHRYLPTSLPATDCSHMVGNLPATAGTCIAVRTARQAYALAVQCVACTAEHHSSTRMCVDNMLPHSTVRVFSMQVNTTTTHVAVAARLRHPPLRPLCAARRPAVALLAGLARVLLTTPRTLLPSRQALDTTPRAPWNASRARHPALAHTACRWI
jgi:hypothetical protein